MSIEDRLAAIEARLRTAEDHLEILNLLLSYGPLVDSGSALDAPKLWTDGGGYNFTTPEGGSARLAAPNELVSLYQSEGHMGLVNTGVSHFTGTPCIKVDGDAASAVGYSFVILKEGDRWYVWRAAINEWTLARTPDGWRIRERFNRTLNGSKESHEVMRRVLSSPRSQ